MLQLRSINRSILDDAAFRQAVGASPRAGEALERHVDRVVEGLRAERVRRAGAAGPLAGVSAAIDAALRTDAVEHLDEEDYPECGKLAIALGLHLVNVASASYHRFFSMLRPTLERIAGRRGRPARVLELACGSGGFAFALDALARKRGLQVEVTASDIVPLYVLRGEQCAARDGVPVTFRRIDALDMQSEADGSYDVVFIAQSVHHFSPGKLARMIAECRRVTTTAFVSVDGYRSLGTLAFLSGSALVSRQRAMVHDAVLSGRKFYAEAELEAIARLAVPDARVTVGRIRPLNTVLTVRFDGGAA